ncbi:pectinesterase/pectinesterase inhibitor [Humulus lupulus]|uniref:pectinesterase/pectinesterase inhibitor n=1 Tax=Humulus lupulus TaxID=3486 RepID=UPI002B405466|nr:pectinesterase/pectinesterase inhibitor [Humulus lupulus]
MAIHQPLIEAPKTSHTKTLFLVLISFAAVISTTFYVFHSFKTTSFTAPSLASNICDRSIEKESCLSMVLATAQESNTPALNNVDHLLKAFLQKTSPQITEALKMANVVSRRINMTPMERAALFDCEELLDVSRERVTDSISSLYLQNLTSHSHDDAHAWLSAVLTNHVTCLDGLEEGSDIRTIMEPKLKELISRARTSLSLIVSVLPSKPVEEVIEPLNGDFPTWVKASDRRLLQSSAKAIQANIVVAKDGSGKYKTVNEAVAAVPDKSKSRFVIYVKKGVYKEKVEIGKNKKNVMLVGDGMDATIITGSLNVVDGSTTFNSATVVAVGDGFIAQDIGFQNTAGPEKHQAVALRVGADQSVINRCRIDAYQDTLYSHSNRQFYRDSSITGTVDFIFGNAAAVFQNCKLIVRKPMKGQKNMVTAQGREDPNQNTGTSIQNCDIIASSDLEPVKISFPSYLGRPWKMYSRTVVMQSNIGDVIVPAGWFEWDGDFALKTLYYGEYLNRGPGAGTSKRVKWAGYHVITSAAEAQKFTVAQLIQGGVWLKSTGVSYTEGL